VAAAIDRNLGGISFSNSPGNIYAKAAKQTLDPTSTGVISLTLNKVVQPRKFAESEIAKEVDIESPLLSKFHGRPTHLRSGIVLPPSYGKELDRKYPVIYNIPGFGGNHLGAVRSRPWEQDGVE